MLYIAAIFVPPIAVAWARKPWQTFFNLLLSCTVIGLLLAIPWAVFVAHGYRVEQGR